MSSGGLSATTERDTEREKTERWEGGLIRVFWGDAIDDHLAQVLVWSVCELTGGQLEAKSKQEKLRSNTGALAVGPSRLCTLAALNPSRQRFSHTTKEANKTIKHTQRQTRVSTLDKQAIWSGQCARWRVCFKDAFLQQQSGARSACWAHSPKLKGQICTSHMLYFPRQDLQKLYENAIQPLMPSWASSSLIQVILLLASANIRTSDWE